MTIEEQLKQISKFIAHGEQFYVDNDNLFDEHWEYFGIYKSINKDGGTSIAAYSNQQRWYETAKQILSFLDSVDFKNASLNEQVKNLEEEVKFLKEELSELDEECEDLYTQNEELDKEVMALEQDLVDLEQEIEEIDEEDLTNKLNEANNEIVRLRAKLNQQSTQSILSKLKQPTKPVHDVLEQIKTEMQEIKNSGNNASMEYLVKSVMITLPETIEKLCSIIEK